MPTAPAPSRRTTIVAALGAVALFVSACGGGSESVDAGGTTTETAIETSSTTTTSTSTPATAPSTTAQAAPAAIPDDSLPGSAIDLGPGAGSTVSVVGVAFDDVLNVRTLPDAASDPIASLTPMVTDLVHTGRKRDVGASIWWEIQLPEGVGWANSNFLAPTAQTGDVTADLVARLGGLASASTVDALVRQVMDHYAMVTEGPPPSVTLVAEPVTGDLIEAWVDVTGYPDDSVLGERLHLFIADEAGIFGLRSVESTTLCRRGVADGLCL